MEEKPQSDWKTFSVEEKEALKSIDIDSAKDFVTKKILFLNSPCHDIKHIQRVCNLGILIHRREKQNYIRPTVACFKKTWLGCLYHDVLDKKLVKNMQEAIQELIIHWSDIGLTWKEIDELLLIIQNVSWSTELKWTQQEKEQLDKINELKIAQDADRLDAVGATGIARVFCYGGEKNRDIEDSIKHFDDKLLLVHKNMKTDTGNNLVKTRHILIQNFYDIFQYEKTFCLKEDKILEQN